VAGFLGNSDDDSSTLSSTMFPTAHSAQEMLDAVTNNVQEQEQASRARARDVQNRHDISYQAFVNRARSHYVDDPDQPDEPVERHKEKRASRWERLEI
jgi:hypothetical protein